MPDNPISGLYPQYKPPTPLDPFQALQAANALQGFQRNQLEIGANKAIGEEYRNALTPNGVDIAKLAAGLKSNPATGYGLPEATSRLIGQQGGMISNTGGQIANTTALFNQRLGMNQVLTNGIGSLANDPDLTRDKVLHWAATTARTTGIPGSIIGPWATSLSDDPKTLRGQLQTLLSAGIGPAGVSSRVEGPPGPGGSPTSIPLGAAIYGGGGSTPGQVATGQPVGEHIGQEGSAARGAALAANATTSPQIHADLENLLTESKVIGSNVSGPTADIEKRWAQLANRLGMPQFATMSADQLRAAEGYDKIAATMAARQASQVGAATDAGRHMTEHMNPALAMSAPGRDMMTRMLHGNQDFIDTAAKEWARQYKGGRGGIPLSAHDEFMRSFVESGADPRVFQFNRLPREDQQRFLHQMDAADLPEFEKNYKEAVRQKWVKPLKAAQ